MISLMDSHTQNKNMSSPRTVNNILDQVECAVHVEDCFNVVKKHVRKPNTIKLSVPKSKIEDKKTTDISELLSDSNGKIEEPVNEHSSDIQYMNEFHVPALDANISKEEQTSIIVSNNKPKYIKPTYNQYEDQRSKAFGMIADKEKVSKSLLRTKACRFVTDGATSDEMYGVCYREQCSFAHSMEELQVPACQFDYKCRLQNGRIDKVSRCIIPNTECKFRHSIETIPEWLNRAHITPPKLPATSELSRKPKTISDISNTFNPLKPTLTPVVYKSITSNISKTLKKPPSVSHSDTASHLRRKKSTNLKHSLPTLCGDDEPNTSFKLKEFKKKPTRYQSDSECDSSSSSGSSSSDSDSDYKINRLKKYQLPSTKKYSKNSGIHIIRVPTNELAEMAIKAAFDRGVYNFQVLVE